ncbi:hypothetical protein RHSIM_Rhsim05G0027300 [Rhododendron simsii]|uniref:F-box associated beta-propeller type 1 domain-containing protein n=1 Tax=Rhododendron simsii TaxID=118357 RepID=A0A834LLQ6_RHOSS|nr:hypothetical protein RHSIM_Rhsim05G0027300 [Rhododendron simsii]
MNVIHCSRCSKTFEERKRLQFPTGIGHFSVKSSCNGVLCLVRSHYVACCYSYAIILWNPSINKFKILPKPCGQFQSSSDVDLSLGIGFVPQTNDYKVVRLSMTRNSDVFYRPQIEMYSLNTDSWTTWTGTDDVQWMLCGETTDASVNGGVHWTARKTNSRDDNLQFLIVSFHLADEVLREICLPEYHRANPNGWSYGFTSVIYEKLAFTMGRRDPGLYSQEVWEIWLLEDYDNSESWTKFRTITTVPTCRNMVPLQFLDNGEFVILDSWKNRLTVFDTKTRQIVGKVMHGSEFEVVNYTQSLVLVKEGIDASKIDNHESDSRRYLKNTSGYGMGGKASVKSKEGNELPPPQPQLSEFQGNSYAIILWNPSINKFKILPKPGGQFETTSPVDDVDDMSVGIGFVPRTNNYKVVHLMSMTRNSKDVFISPQIEMYSLSTDSWTTWTGTCDVQWRLHGKTTDASVNGAVHWTAMKTTWCDDDDNGSQLIVSFDLEDEVLREICLPECHCGRPNRNYGFISVIFEKLAFTIDCGDEDLFYQKVWEIWLLEDYNNNRESWTRFRTITMGPTFMNMVPVQFLNNGEFVVCSGLGRLIVFDPKTQQIVAKELRGAGFIVVNYTQSLVLVNEGTDGPSTEMSSFAKELKEFVLGGYREIQLQTLFFY